MLDIKLIRENPNVVREALAKRNTTVDLDAVITLDSKRRTLLLKVEELKHKRNEESKAIGRLKQAGEDITSSKQAVKQIGTEISELDAELREIDGQLTQYLLTIPNVPHPTAPVGADESANRHVATNGEIPDFPFEPKPHWELGGDLGILDFEKAAKISGAGFYLLRGMGARLERALIQFMLDLHTKEHNYEEISPPFLSNSTAMTGTGQLPKMQGDMYHLADDDFYLVPTAEVPVVNLYREQIIQAPLPIKMVAYTPCFRREAGAAGSLTRGLNRLHQFNKVELIKLVEPETSYQELELMRQDAEQVLKLLELPYQIVELSTGDMSFAAAKCYDLELWAPGQQKWLEVSSCSNCEDFQARRASIRYRGTDGKAHFVHTLNGSGVALPRLLVALLENGQQADGSIELPKVLSPYLGGVTKIEGA